MADKEVRVRITGDISDLLKKLESVKDAFNDIGDGDTNNKGINNLIDDLQRVHDEIELIETSMDEVVESTKKFDGTNFSDMIDELSDANRQADELSDSFRELNDVLDNLDTRAFEDLNDSIREMDDLDRYIEALNFDEMTESIRESEDALREFYNTQEKVFDSENNGFVDSMETITELGHEAADIYQQIAEQVEDINLNASLDSDNRDSNRFDAIKEGLISGAVAGQTMKSSLSDVANSLDDVSAAFKELGNIGTTLEEKVDAFHRLTPAIEEASDEIERLRKEEQSLKGLDDVLKGATNYEEYSDKIRTAIEETTEAKQDLIEKSKELRQVRSEAGNEFKKYAGWYDSLSAKVKEFVENEENGIFIREKVAKSFQQVTDAMKDMYKLNDEGTNKNMEDLENKSESSLNKMEELREEIARVKKEMKELQDVMYHFGPSNDIYKEMKQYMDEAEKIAKEMDKLYGDGWFDKGFSKEDDSIQNYIKDMENLYDICKKINNLESLFALVDSAEREYMNKLRPELGEYNKELQKEEKTYEKLKETIEKLTKSYESMNKAVNKVNDSGADDLFDNISKKANEAAKSVSLVDFDILKNGLDKLGERINDKTEKLIRFQQVNKELNDEMKKSVNSMNNQGKAIKDYADNAGYAVEVIKPLIEGTKLLSSEGFNIIGNDANLEKLKQQEQLFRDNIEVIEEYMRVLKDSGSEISKSFFDELGKFDADKFLNSIEAFGDPLNQLTMQMQTYKQQILESLKAEKESIEAKRKLASEALELAQNNQKAAEAQMESVEAAEREATTMEEQAQAYAKIKKAKEELARTTEELLKAVKEYNDINSSATDEKRIQNAKDLVKQYNEQAEALRKMGAAVKDIDLDDIKDFDKSLGTNLKDIFDIDSDVPKRFSEFIEDIKAAFTELKDLDFGNAFDIFKDIGKGLLDKLPGELKAVIEIVTVLTTATKKLYDAGKQQFFEGLTNIGNMLEPVWDMLTNVGDEIRDAFENITGMDLDLGSLIEQVVEFEGTLAKVKTAASASETELGRLEDKARSLGATSRYSATDVATAMDELATAGWSVQEILDGIEAVVNLSEGSFIDLGDAAEFVANGLTSLGMNASQASDFVDIVSQAAVKTSTDVGQMQKAFTNAASTAGTLGVSASDLATALGLMANQGVKGAKAGTALKNLMTNMASPTKQMTACIEEYNLQAAQTAIVNGDLMGGVIKLKQAFDDSNLSVKEQVKVISTLAGKEALPGVAALMNNTVETMNSLKFAVDSSTKSSRAYAESLGLVNEKGEMAYESFEKMIEVKGKEYEQWQNFNKVLNESVDYMTMVGGTTTDLGAIIHKLGEDGEVTSDQVGSLVDIFGKMRESSKETTAVLEQYGIQIGKTEDGMFDFGETVKNLGAVWDTLTESQKEQLVSQLGVETSVAELNELFSDNGEKIEDLITAYENMQSVSEHLADSFDSTVKGALLNLASAMEEQCLQAFDSMKEGLLDAANALTEFFNIWNGLSDLDVGSGFIAALSYLSEEIKTQSEGWGEALSQGIQNAISGLDTIVNSSTFDNILQIGTNIITGICDGIQKAKDSGSLDSAIDGAIKKICAWIETNAPQVEEAGLTIIESLKNGLLNNQEEITGALDALCSVINSWAASSGDLKAAATTLADTFIASFGESLLSKGANTINEWLGPLVSLLNPGMQDYYKEGGGPQLSDQEQFFKDTMSFKGLLEGAKKGWQSVVDWFTGEAHADELGEDTGTQIGDGIGTGMSNAKESTTASANEIGTGISEGIMSKLETLDSSGLQSLGVELLALQTITESVSTGMATSFTNIQNSARTSFMGLANIVRNQLLNCTNIVRNQALNMSNIFNNQFTNMANNVRTQMVNVSNIINNQMTNCANVVRTQALNMSNIFNNQFTNMANNVRTQMVNVSNIINNQMTNACNVIRTQAVNMSNIFNNQFTNMANNVRTQMVNVSNIINNQMTNACNMVRTQAVNMSNIFNNQFTNMANNVRTQMVNISNIINNQMTNAANVVRTQAVNMSNIFNNQFTNMANNVRTQMTNISNIINNQMTNACNVVRTQALNMSNIFNNQFTTIANNVRTQMTNVSNIINNQMTNAANVVRTQATNMANIFNNQFTTIANNVRTQMTNVSNIINNQMTNAANVVRTQATNMANIFNNKFTTIANNVRTQMTNVSNIINNQMTNAANVVRTQAISMANVFNNQFTSIANSVRTQMTNVSNIIRNQMTNAANAMRTECVNMANIARNQFVNITNIIKNQAPQWASTVKSQASAMKSAFSSTFSGLSSIAAREMASVLSTVRSYMSQIASAVSQKMTINVDVNKTVTTTNITKTETAPASAAYAMRAINASTFALSAPRAMAVSNTNNDTGGGAFSRNKFGYGPLSLEVPVILDGREIARASASYTQDELNKLEKRSKRKRGE